MACGVFFFFFFFFSQKYQLERRLREALLRPIICHHEIEAYQPQTSIIYYYLLPMDSHARQEFHAVANFRWVLHKRSSFVVVLTWFTYGYSCPSMANIKLSSEVKNHALPWHRRWSGQHGLSQGLWSLMSEEKVRQNVGFWVRQSVQIKEWAWLRTSYKNHMNSAAWSLDLIAWASRVLLDDKLTVLSAMIYTNNWHLELGDTSIQV